MSATGAQELLEVRRILADPDNGKPVVLDDPIKQALDRSVCIASVRMGLGELKVSEFITLVAGTFAYTLSADTPYDMIGELRFQSDNALIERVSQKYVESLREGTSTVTSRPQVHYLSPQQNGTTLVTFWPCPTAAEAVTGWVNLEPQAWGSSETASTIPFSQRGLRGLELLTAAAVVKALSADKLNALRLERSVAKEWEAEAMADFRDEKIRVIRLKRAAGPASPRWLDTWAGVYIGPRR